MCVCVFVSVFFSGRRWHTRFKCDWSSGVCSSDLELILSLINRSGCKLSFRCEGQPDVHEYTCTNANEMSTQNADKSLISNAASIGGPIEVKNTIKHICGQF